jgi:3-deoxy-D-manno-octulosonic-acid transferase
VIGFYLGLSLYNLLAAAAAVLAMPFVALACLWGCVKWRERCGLAPRPERPSLWVHAASVGEVMMIRPLLAELQSRRPGHALALSTMTGTGREAARSILGERGRAFFFPLDLIWTQLWALSRLRPEMVVVCETELWPNLMWLCRLKGIPFLLVNARISERSLSYYRALRFLFGPLLAKAALIACQSQAEADRFASIAGPKANITVAGNLKYDGISRPPSAGQRAESRTVLGIGSDDVVLVAGSTRENEEEMVLGAWQGATENSKLEIRNSKLILAPRHPDRFQKVALLLGNRGIEFARRSLKGRISDSCRVMLWDTLGELTTAYQAGDIAFVGGSLVPVGGHNPLEPASMGLPVVFGTHMFNARESAEALLEAGGAMQAGSESELQEVLAKLMDDSEKRVRAGQRAREAVEARRGAARRTAEQIIQLLHNDVI